MITYFVLLILKAVLTVQFSFPPDFKQSCASLAPSWSPALQHPVSTAQQQPRRSTMAWTISSGSSLRKDWSTTWPVSLTALICPGILIAHCWYFPFLIYLSPVDLHKYDGLLCLISVSLPPNFPQPQHGQHSKRCAEASGNSVPHC